MQTNFFQQIASLNLSGNIRLNIQPQENGEMTVSLLLVNETLKEKAAGKLPPLLLRGSVAELDQKFFETIAAPVQKTHSLLCNLKEHEAAIKTVQSGSNKTSTASAVSSKTARRAKLDEQLKKVSELEKAGKIGQAIGQMPDPKQFGEYVDEINNRMQQLRAKHSTLSLFGEQPEVSPEATSTLEQEPVDEDEVREEEEDDAGSEEEEEPEEENEELGTDDEFDPNR